MSRDHDSGLERLDGLEKLIGGKPFRDASWLTRGDVSRACVCMIRFGAIPQGTGFLIAPDLVVTCRHVVASALDGSVPATSVCVVFDYIKPHDGSAAPSRELRLTSGTWCVASSPIDEHDFALLRLEHDPGLGWIEASADPFPFEDRPGLVIVQHPQGQPQKLAFSDDERGELYADGRRVRYRISTEGGSSGSPVFGIDDWKIAALHQGWEELRNRGVPFHLIAARADVKEQITASKDRARATRAMNRTALTPPKSEPELAVDSVLSALAGHGDGYEMVAGNDLLRATGLSRNAFKDAISLARERRLITAQQVIPTQDNGGTGIVWARLHPKGRELLRRGGKDVASPADDARTLHRLLREAGEGESRGRVTIDSRALAKQLPWPPGRILEAAEILDSQGVAKFAQRTLNNSFALALTASGRL